MTVDEALVWADTEVRVQSRYSGLSDTAALEALAAEVRRLHGLLRAAFLEGTNTDREYYAGLPSNESVDDLAWNASDSKAALDGKPASIDYGPGPGPMDPHDRIDELERDDGGS